MGWGCESCPTDGHVITAMRVMGTVFDPAVASPGGRVTVRVVTADVEEREVTVAWYRCRQNLGFVTERGGADHGDFSSLVAPCLADGVFAYGTSVTVNVDADGGRYDTLSFRTRRRWTDLVGFACAGGSIEAPRDGSVWPRCTGTLGVVFTASIPGPTPNGALSVPPRATITAPTFTQGTRTLEWTESTVPEVPRCTSVRRDCEGYRLNFSVSDATVAIEPAAAGSGVLGGADDSVAFVGWHVSAMAPVSTDHCQPFDPDAVLHSSGAAAWVDWVPPADPGEVVFWFTARRFSGGLDVLRRTVRVQ